jgi:hypothetical protein
LVDGELKLSMRKVGWACVSWRSTRLPRSFFTGWVPNVTGRYLPFTTVFFAVRSTPQVTKILDGGSGTVENNMGPIHQFKRLYMTIHLHATKPPSASLVPTNDPFESAVNGYKGDTEA